MKSNTATRFTGIKIIYNRLLDGWFVVRGPHQTPLGGRYDTYEEALAWLNRGDS